MKKKHSKMGKKVNKKVLESLVEGGMLFCKKHGGYVSLQELYKKRCYIGFGKYRYCKYVKIIKHKK